MTDYWKSQARKFCDTCKCWIADNKASIAFHENGRKHQQNTELRLDDIRKRGAAADKKAAKEQQWIAQMEAAALNDYITKDIGDQTKGTNDNNERKIQEQGSSGSIGPQMPGAMSESVSSDPREISPGPSGGGGFRPVDAPKSGTKWHKDDTKKWFEAKSDDGHIYFWHVETNASRWDPPPEGYYSIKDQEEANKKHEVKEQKKIYNMYQSQAIHGTHQVRKEEDERVASQIEVGPDGKAQPYGKWQTVESAPVSSATSKPIDYQVPVVAKPAQPSVAVTLHNDQQTKFKEKSTPSLGGQRMSEAKIVFKKRKTDTDHRKNFRRRADGDE